MVEQDQVLLILVEVVVEELEVQVIMLQEEQLVMVVMVQQQVLMDHLLQELAVEALDIMLVEGLVVRVQVDPEEVVMDQQEHPLPRLLVVMELQTQVVEVEEQIHLQKDQKQDLEAQESF